MYGRRSYIPIMAIVGFLGAGKTTLLNHLLKQNQGLKIGVIVNDFGDINIDSMLVARQTDQELELSNGCICCSLEGNSLDDAIGQLAHPGSTIDYIVIEASGLAEPKELLRLLINSKNPHARFDSLVSVVDGSNVLDTKEKHPGFVEQLALSDIVIVNKVDTLSKAKLKKVDEYLQFISGSARILHAEYSMVDTRLLLDPDSTKSSGPDTSQLALSDASEDHSEHLHHNYQAFSYSSDKPLDPKKWDQFVAKLPRSIYRAKGFIFFGMKGLGQKFVFQKVGNRHEMKLDEWLSKPPKTELVFIGDSLDPKSLQTDLDKLIDKTPDDLSNDSIMDVFQYR